MELLFSKVGLEPPNFYQNQVTGANRIEKAKACRFDIETRYLDDETNLRPVVKKFNSEAMHIIAHFNPPAGSFNDFLSQMD